MAKTAAAAPAEAPEGAPPKKKFKLVLILAALLLLAGGGGASWYFMAGSHDGEEHAKAEAPKPPVFMPLDPFTVNLAEESGDHYLQVGIVYQVTDDKVIDQLKTYMPVLRNQILLLLSAKKPSELAPAEGKKKLVDELVATARTSLPAMPGTAPDKGIAGALLASFVIQ